ncbi:MAG: hypothetical protein S0880_12475 [Actinomycetota bacterium]|nr:hypothetical protein [Actinomycetota bacterium]
MAVAALGSLVLVVAPAAAQTDPSAVPTEPAGTDGSRPADVTGPCEVEARVGSAVVVPRRSGGVYTLPAAADVVYDARLGPSAVDGPSEQAGAAGDGSTAPRAIEGDVALRLPWPLGSATITSWEEEAVAGLGETGRFGYDLDPRWAPIGAILTVDVVHRDGDVTCAGSVAARLGGGFLDGAVRPAAAGLTVAGLAATALAARPRRQADGVDAHGVRHGLDDEPVAGRARARGRPVIATVTGAVTGLAVGADLVLASVVAFEGPALAAGTMVGAIVGAAAGWWAPWRRHGTGTDDGDDAGGPRLWVDPSPVDPSPGERSPAASADDPEEPTVVDPGAGDGRLPPVERRPR